MAALPARPVAGPMRTNIAPSIMPQFSHCDVCEAHDSHKLTLMRMFSWWARASGPLEADKLSVKIFGEEINV
jgi:hypothetical protein